MTETVDVAIVGGGIVGLVTAFELAKTGRRPVVIERNRIVGAVSGHTTAKVTSQHGIRYGHIDAIHGREKAKAYADANQAAIEWLFSTCDEEDFECGLERDFACTYTERAEDGESFSNEREVCSELGLPVSQLGYDGYPVEIVDSVVFKDQARFHPVEFLFALTQKIVALGGAVYEHSPVMKMEEKDGGVELNCQNHTIYANEAVVATHYPVFDSALFIAKLAPYRSYAMAARVQAPPPPGMFISNEDELHSWRRHKDVLIIGAGCHKVGQEPDTINEYSKLENWARKKFGVQEVVARWSAQDNKTHDHLPYVGRSPGKEHIYVATGFDGWGMSNGIAAGRTLTKLLMDESDPLIEALDPARLSLKGFSELVSENANAVGHLTTDRFHDLHAGAPEDMAPGEAGVFADGSVTRIAAYRDEKGVLHKNDATCPHFKCQVSWNPAERTWDCPCHGSRFACTGEVIQAPAITGLAPVKQEARRPS